MGVIVRTAGANKSKNEIEKDFNNTNARNQLESLSYFCDVDNSVIAKKGNYSSSTIRLGCLLPGSWYLSK